MWLTTIAVALGGCAHDRKPPPGAIEMVVTADVETLDPRFAVDVVGLRATRLVHAGLARSNADTLAPEPYVAKRWWWTSPLELHVELRDDVRFHVAKRVVEPADVVATLTAFATVSRHARVVEPIASSWIAGPREVAILLKRPHGSLLTDLELPVLRADEAAGPPAPDGTLDGLGPYVVAHAARGAIQLDPIEGGALPKPAHAVVLRTVHDENARALRLFAGSADVVLNAMSPTLLPAMEKEHALSVRSRPAANVTYLLARVDRPPLDDVEVRRAISSVIDREAIVRGSFAGHARAASGLIPPGHWAHVDMPALPFDPHASLAAHHLKLALLTSTDRSRIAVARFIGQELADAGASVEVIPLELGTMLARLNAGDFDLAILQIPEIAEPNVVRVFLHGSYVPPAGSNRGRLRDPEIDRLLDEGDAVNDLDARRAVYARLEQRLRETMAVIPLWNEDHVVITSARASAFTPSAEGRWLGLAAIP